MVTFPLIVITLQIKEKKESFGHTSAQNSPQRADTPPRSNKKYNLKKEREGLSVTAAMMKTEQGVFN